MAIVKQDSELGLGHGPLARRHNPLLLGSVQDQEEEFGCGLVTGEMAPGADRSTQLGIERLDGVCNQYEDLGACRLGWDRLVPGVWCDHPGRGAPGAREVGRPMYSMSRELVLVAGRPCDLPGCAASADP